MGDEEWEGGLRDTWIISSSVIQPLTSILFAKTRRLAPDNLCSR